MNTNYAALYYTDISKDLDLIEKNVQDYPASSVARFMLLYHLKKNNDPRFDDQAKQAGIYLHNPYWMEFQLAKLQSGNSNILVDDQEGSVSSEEDKNGEATEWTEQDADTLVEKNEEENETGNIEVKEQIPENLSLENETIRTENEENFNEPGGANFNEEQNQLIEQETKEEDLPVPVNEQISENLPSEIESIITQNEENFNEPGGANFNEEQNQLVEQETKEEDLPAPVNEQIPENLPWESVITEDINEEFVEKTNEDAVLNNEIVEVPLVEEATENLVTDEKLAEVQSEQQNETVSSAEEELANFNKDESVQDIKVPQEQENSPAEAVDDIDAANKADEDVAIPFEPLHTVDYFASQGIRLNEESLNNDQLGKQVKSFTAWLKSMKKLHPDQLPEQNEVIEKLIQTSSDASNQHANVLTEAMAEVLVKQGKREKAIEMYEKLSLINPSKSAYFAAKIESLKTL